MPSNKLNVLITRPEKAGRVLQQHLQTNGVGALCQPFFDYQAKASVAQAQAFLARPEQAIIIFISVAAVEFAHQQMPCSRWQYQHVIAVGSATQKALQALGITALSPIRHDSEGVLALPQLSDVDGAKVLIVRGDGGREFLAEQLTLRGAQVQYLESYRRVWRELPAVTVQTWQKNNINCILVTSNDLLQSIVHLIESFDSNWKNQCCWIVASARIAENASELGLKNVVNANGASDKAMFAALNLISPITAPSV